MFKIKDWLKYKEEKSNILYMYNGEMNTDIISEILMKIEDMLAKEGERTKVIRRIYNVMVESLQNLYHHVDEANIDFKDFAGIDKLERKYAVVLLEKEKFSYKVTAGNIVTDQKIRILKDKMDQINALTSDEIKSLYKLILNNQEFSERGGGGLGMIDIAKRTGSKLEYDFEQIDDNYSFFFLNININ